MAAGNISSHIPPQKTADMPQKTGTVNREDTGLSDLIARRRLLYIPSLHIRGQSNEVQ